MNKQLLLMVALWLSAVNPSVALGTRHLSLDQTSRQEPVKGVVVGTDGTPIPGASVKSLYQSRNHHE